MILKILWKTFSFDKKAILDEFADDGDESVAALSSGGSSILQRAKALLRRRKRSAAPGQAPSVHSPNENLSFRNIVAAYDFQSRTEVVGTVRTRGGNIPRLVAAGGTVNRGGKSMHYRPHPWMPKALHAEQSNLPSHWGRT